MCAGGEGSAASTAGADAVVAGVAAVAGSHDACAVDAAAAVAGAVDAGSVAFAVGFGG
ncbi:hypothetical protein [Actinomadura sp. K4S16]|uniref:hypothetical protein n=1 Tax=Actinomadura sp. K4S16 TaxID=1316147 RepID=UPI0013575576|nr:hypothetical protein [Actinomadura sp. K4S16]